MTASSEYADSSSDDLSSQNANCEELIYRLAQQAHGELQPAEFEDLLLHSAVRGLNGQGGLLWMRAQAMDGTSLVVQTRLGQPMATHPDEEWQALRRNAISAGQSRVIGATGESLDGLSTGALSGLPLQVVLQPLAAESQTAVLLEVHQRADLSEESQHESRSFLGMLTELHAEYLKSQKLKRLEEQSRIWKSFQKFSRDLQQYWNPTDIYSHIVDGGRELSGFDRLTLLTGSGKRCRMRLVSSTDYPSRHSQTVKKLQDLCAVLTVSGQGLRYEGNSDQILAPEIQSKLNEVLNETHARILQAVLLTIPDSDEKRGQSEVPGVLVGEHFRSDLEPTSFARLQEIAVQAAPAVVRAAYWENLPARWILHGWIGLRGSPFQRTRSAWRWFLFAVVLLVSLLVFIPADFEVKATGQLQPVNQQHVFAPMNAIVHEIHFQEERPLAVDQLLLTLRDPNLELKLEEVQGERAQVDARLRTIQTMRSNLIRNSSNAKSDDELAAEAIELRQRRDSLEAQWKILQRKEKQLKLLSPVSGVVLTWNSQDLLKSRPVSAGQLLLTVADTTGDWRIDVKIPENDIGHVRNALRENSGKLPLKYSMDAQTGETYTAVLQEKRISRRTEIDADLRHFVQAVVPISSRTELEPISGAEVTLRIHCGTRALGYVLFHDLYEWLHRNIIF